MEKDNPICYVGIDDMGNIMAAIVHKDDNAGRTALFLADMILNGLHVMPMDAESIRQTFGQEAEGPHPKILPHLVRISYVDNHGTEIHLREGDKSLAADENFDHNFDYKPRVDEEEYKVHKKASEVLMSLGIRDWLSIRTLGDVERLREQITTP